MNENIIGLILDEKNRQIVHYAVENKKLRKLLSDICEGCIRGEVTFDGRGKCFDCQIGEALKQWEKE